VRQTLDHPESPSPLTAQSRHPSNDRDGTPRRSSAEYVSHHLRVVSLFLAVCAFAVSSARTAALGAQDVLPPNATITNPTSPVTINAGESIFFSGTGDNPDGPIVGYSWTFEGGNPATSGEQGLNCASPCSIGPISVTFATPGNYIVTFTVNDVLFSDPTPDSRSVTVVAPPPTNQPPQSSIDSPSTNVTIQAGQSVDFSGSGTDTDGTIQGWSWSFPGGSPSSSTAEDPGNVTFSTPGNYTVTFTVTDDDGASDASPASRMITVTAPPASNQAPESSIDSPSTNVTIQAGQSVFFNGSGTDPDGTIQGWAWSFPGGSPSSSTAEDPGNVTFSTPGNYTVTFTVTDDDGASDASPATRAITVTPPPGSNNPPNAAINTPPGNVTIQAGQSVNFTGTATDSDGNVVSHSWNIPGGTPSSSTAEDAGSVTFSNPGNFSVTYNATDNGGFSDPSPDTRSITVTPASGSNQPPNASITSPAGDVTIVAGQSVSFAGAGNDPDGSVSAYSWSFPGGSPSGSNSQNPGNVTFAAPGNYTVSLNVTDNSGFSDPTPATRTITVTSAPGSNQAPDAVIISPSGNVTVQAGQSVVFGGGGSDNDGTIVAYSWTFPGGSPPSSNVQNPGAVIFANPGVYSVSFNVTDNQGASDPSPATRTITVTPASGNNQPPNATINSPAGNITVQVGQSVSFSGTGSDPDGSIVAFSWTFPGGVPSGSDREDPGLVAFSTPGVYTVTFNVTDNSGASDPTPDRRVVTVTQASPSNDPPNAVIDSPSENVTIPVGGSVSFAGSGSDPDGQVVAFLWNFDGGAPNQNLEDPGTVTFTAQGTFNVTFNVTDNQGASDPSPPSVRVVVGDGGAPGGTQKSRNVDVRTSGSENRVDGHDVLYVLRAIATQDLTADVNDDGRVDESDVQLTLAGLGKAQ
jgi:PKD repeat protein